MGDGEKKRKIKPDTPVPATYDEIVEGVPDRDVTITTASRLLGVRSPQLKDVLRQHGSESVGQFITLEQIAKAYALLRPDLCILSDAHFTTDDGLEGLIRLITYLDEPVKRRDTSPINKILSGSAFDHVRELPEQTVQTVVSSPPYWGTRVYPENFTVNWSDGTTTPFGGEQTPEEYIRHTVEFFLLLSPVLKQSGTVWWNVGDIYNTRSPIRGGSLERMNAMSDGDGKTWTEYDARRYSSGHEFLKDKDLTLIPYRLAEALQRAGFWVRSIIIWQKENVVPESVNDRPTNACEVVLLVSNSEQYKFDEMQWRESDKIGGPNPDETENLRTVWTFRTATGDENHAAPFPIELPARCITLSTEPEDIVYDPFMGSGTTGVASRELNRNYIGSEIVDEYIRDAEERIGKTDAQTKTQLDDFV